MSFHFIQLFVRLTKLDIVFHCPCLWCSVHQKAQKPVIPKNLKKILKIRSFLQNSEYSLLNFTRKHLELRAPLVFSGSVRNDYQVLSTSTCFMSYFCGFPRNSDHIQYLLLKMSQNYIDYESF